MELHQDAYRIHEILENVDYDDILKFLRTKVPLRYTEIRCQLALQHFLNVERERTSNLVKEENTGINADFLRIKHLIKSATDEDIQEVLEILGPIPNRILIAIKLLLRNNPLCRIKRKNDNGDICDASSSKLVKIGELNGTSHPESSDIKNLELTDRRTKEQKPLKLTIKSVKDRDGNDKFVVTSPSKIKSETQPIESEAEEISTTTSDVLLRSNQQDNILLPVDQIVNSAVIESTTGDLSNELPSTSSNFQNKAGPSFLQSTRSLDLLFQDIDEIISVESSTSRLPEINAVPSISTSQESDAMPSTSKSIKADDDVEIIDLSSTLIEDRASAETVDLNQNLKKEVDFSQVIDEKLVLKLIEMFPEASSDFIRNVCAGKKWSEHNFDEIVTVILSTSDYPKRPERLPSPAKEVDPEEQFNMLKELFTDADPSYLHEKLDQFAGDQDALQRFIEDAMEHKNYPTLKEYQRKQKLSAQQKQYTTEFNVERFVELFPDPVSVFEDPTRKSTILDQSDKCYVKWFMRNKFNQLYAKDVNSIVESEGDKNIVSIVKALNTCLAKGCLKRSKWISHSRPDTQNIPLLQELAYFENIEKIYSHIENKKKQADLERHNAKELGLLQCCSCCYDEEVMPNDILTCTGGCRFCRHCIRRGAEIAFSEGKVTFPCLMDCDAEFGLQVLQCVLPPKVFSKLAQKKAVAEVKAAGIEELEACPFCDFATIPVPEDRLFRCLNPDCMKESCRLCKEPSHVPLRCDEVEKDEAVKARTYIEDKMTEALIRQCWKCNAKFIKEEGCNKMTCSCGALMCYVCRKPVKDYKHFNGQGGDRHDLCPLYADNFEVNENIVLQAAAEAKKQVDPSQLKNDPTSDLQKHFGDKIKVAKRKEELQRLRVELEQQRRMMNALNRNDFPQFAIPRWDDQLLGGGVGPPQHQPPYVYGPPLEQAHGQRRIANVHIAAHQHLGPNLNVEPNHPEAARFIAHNNNRGVVVDLGRHIARQEAAPQHQHANGNNM